MQTIIEQVPRGIVRVSVNPVVAPCKTELRCRAGARSHILMPAIAVPVVIVSKRQPAFPGTDQAVQRVVSIRPVAIDRVTTREYIPVSCVGQTDAVRSAATRKRRARGAGGERRRGEAGRIVAGNRRRQGIVCQAAVWPCAWGTVGPAPGPCAWVPGVPVST